MHAAWLLISRCCRTPRLSRAVYKASWRQAPVAVKYIVCRTDDHDSLGRAIREVVLSKKMSHPNVVGAAGRTSGG